MEREQDSPEYWLDAHGGALYRYALLHLRDEHKAEEAVQETLLAALQARDRFGGGSSLRTWLIGILKHKILDQFRREAREVPLDDPDVTPDEGHEVAAASFLPDGHWSARLAEWGDPVAAMENGQFWAILQRCLELLPPRLSRLFIMRELLEQESEKICKELAMTPTNLWTTLYRARMGLRQCLDRNWVGETRG